MRAELAGRRSRGDRSGSGRAARERRRQDLRQGRLIRRGTPRAPRHRSGPRGPRTAARSETPRAGAPRLPPEKPSLPGGQMIPLLACSTSSSRNGDSQIEEIRLAHQLDDLLLVVRAVERVHHVADLLTARRDHHPSKLADRDLLLAHGAVLPHKRGRSAGRRARPCGSLASECRSSGPAEGCAARARTYPRSDETSPRARMRGTGILWSRIAAETVSAGSSTSTPSNGRSARLLGTKTGRRAKRGGDDDVRPNLMSDDHQRIVLGEVPRVARQASAHPSEETPRAHGRAGQRRAAGTAAAGGRSP